MIKLIPGMFYECKTTHPYFFERGTMYLCTTETSIKDQKGVVTEMSEDFFQVYFNETPYTESGVPLPLSQALEKEAQEDQPLESKKPANILNLEVGKYYECKEPSEINKRHKFLVGHRYLADGKCHIIDENKNRIRIFRSEFKELFHNNPLDTSGETLYPPPLPLRQEPAKNTPYEPYVRKTLADEAYELIGGDRLEEYGDMRRSFENIGKVWSVLLGIEVSAEKVGLMMVGLKLVRENNKHKRDNLVDLIGYTALLGRLEGEE